MKSFRPERVAHVIRAVVSEAITNRLSDPRIVPLSSVTRVEVTADLEHAKVWISVMGPEPSQRRTIAGLRSARGFVQKLVAQELAIRTCPQISFVLDRSIKKAAETMALIDQAMAELGEGPAAETSEEAPDQEVSDEEASDEVEADDREESDQGQAPADRSPRPHGEQ